MTQQFDYAVTAYGSNWEAARADAIAWQTRPGAKGPRGARPVEFGHPELVSRSPGMGATTQGADGQGYMRPLPALHEWRVPVRWELPEPEPHYPTQAELAEQRAEFALDSAEDRPYHHLARASFSRGRAWNAAISACNGSYSLAGMRRHEPAERDRHERLYVSEAPFLRTRTAGDADKWAEALREGPYNGHIAYSVARSIAYGLDGLYGYPTAAARRSLLEAAAALLTPGVPVYEARQRRVCGHDYFASGCDACAAARSAGDPPAGRLAAAVQA